MRPPLYDLPETSKLADLFCGITRVSLAANALGIEVVFGSIPVGGRIAR